MTRQMHKFDTPSQDPGVPAVDLGATLSAIRAVLMRHVKLLITMLVIFVALAILYVLQATPQYQARASIMIDPRISQSPGAPTAPTLLLSDALVVDSEIRVLTSREVTGQLAERLGLYEPSTEPPEEQGLLARIGSTLRDQYAAYMAEEPADMSPQDAATAEERRREGIRRDLVRNLTVERAGGAYVIDISYTAAGRARAAEVVNTLIDVYFVNASQQAIAQRERTTRWLSGRLDTLSKDVQEADAAVANYRQQNALYTMSGEGTPAEAELSTATHQLIDNRSQQTTNQVSLDQLTDQLSGGPLNIETISSLSTTLSSPALTEYQQRYAELLQQEQESIAVRGENSSAVQTIRSQQQQLRTLIFNELGQIRDRLMVQQKVLKRQQTEIETRIDQARERATEEARKSIDLRELQRNADSKRRLYETMLSEFNTSTQEASFQVAPARVISWAVPPDQKSAPNSKQIVVLAAFAAIVLASSWAFMREALDKSFRLSSEIPEQLGLPFLGVVPRIRDDRGVVRRRRRSRGKLGERVPSRLQSLVFAASEPRSMMAETLRSTLVQVSSLGAEGGVKNGGEVLSFISSSKGEGKSTLCMNFGTLLASHGSRTVVLDLDLYNSAITRQVGNLAGTALLGTLLQTPSAVTSLEPVRELLGLSVVVNKDLRDFSPANPLHATQLRNLIRALSERYDYVIVDMPPISGLADARVVAGLCDHLILTMRWGKASKTEVATMLRASPTLQGRVAGAIFSRAGLRRYISYNGPSAASYYDY